MSGTIYSPGLLHIINNSLKDVGPCMSHYVVFEEQLRTISKLVARPWLRKRLLATCYSTEPASHSAGPVRRANLQLYTGRWESLIRVLGQTLSIRAALQVGWSLQRFCHGGAVSTVEERGGALWTVPHSNCSVGVEEMWVSFLAPIHWSCLKICPSSLTPHLSQKEVSALSDCKVRWNLLSVFFLFASWMDRMREFMSSESWVGELWGTSNITPVQQTLLSNLCMRMALPARGSMQPWWTRSSIALCSGHLLACWTPS